MIVRFRKRTRDRHVLEIVRDDGSTSATELETRSCLRHDLMHFAFERRARLTSSLYGALRGGAELTAMTKQAAAAPAELQGTEVLVGMLQGAEQKGVDGEAFVPFAREMLALQGHALPAYLTSEFVRSVLADYRKLHGQWQSLRLGGVLELPDA